MAASEYEQQLKDFKTLSSSFFPPAAVLTAIDLGLFDALAEAPATATTLAGRLGVKERPLRLTLGTLASLGYLARDGDLFRNTPFTARALVSSSSEYEGDSALMSLWFLRLSGGLAEVLRTGKPATTYEATVKAQPRMAASLVRAMDQISRPFLPGLVQHVSMQGVRRVLDVGGASGSYAMALVEHNPEATATVMELPLAAEEAERIIAARGMSDRVKVQRGDLRADPLGDGYDLVFFSNVFHLLDPAAAADAVQKCARALRPGGRLVVKDMIGNEAGEAPGLAVYQTLMLLISDGGALHPQAAYEEWCARAGMGPIERINCWERSALLISRKPA